jgi:glycosyltransferase involved in cell wall biosynthesis
MPGTFEFIHPGDLSTKTGGYRYARQLLAALARRGVAARVHRLADSFPFPDDDALAEAGAVLAGIPASRTVVIDGLAFGAMERLAGEHAARLKLVALVHHPLALETGLDAAPASRLAASERAALASACAVVVTSPATAAALRDYGVAPPRITVVLPGTQRPRSGAASRRATGEGPVRLLCVASLTPRKGHLELVEALAALARREPSAAWRLRCVGSLERDPACVARLRARIDALELGDRVVLDGERDEAGVDRAYADADLFVLASYHEGYGMVLAEAVAHGLPLVSTTAGAIPQTVPAGAGLLVAPGDVAALSRALEQAIAQPALRSALGAAACAAAAALPDWDDAAEQFDSVLRRLDRARPSTSEAR